MIIRIHREHAHRFTGYQDRALAYASPRERIALFMEMRLGKSPVSIRWAKRRHAKRVLLVAPLSTLLGQLNWQGELTREGIAPVMLPHLRTQDRMGVIRPATLRDGMLRRRWATGWFGVNFESATEEILRAPWDTIIVDESTRIRNPKAQVTKRLTRETQHIPNRAILSGLPNPESPMDYFSQFVFLDGHFMDYDNFWAFRQTHFYTRFTNWDWTPKKGVSKRIKQYVHDNAFILSRKEAGVGSKKFREQRTVELNNAQHRVLKEMKRDFAIDGIETKWVPVIHTWMQRVAGGFHPVTHEMLSDAKIRLTEELVMDEFRREPLVVWFRFNNEIEAVYKWLRRRNKKLKVAYVHGNMRNSKTRRARAQQRFQDGDTRVLLLQASLGKFGWKLSAASTAVYYSNNYEFEVRSQSEDRIIHLTKTNPCLYIDLVTLGTPDEDVVDALSSKRLTAKIFNARFSQSQLLKRVA